MQELTFRIHLNYTHKARAKIEQMHIIVSVSILTVTDPSDLLSQQQTASMCNPAPTFCTIVVLTIYLKLGQSSLSCSTLL
jgi:hypothetical protein